MAWYVSNEFDYNDNGRKIHKQEWTDDATGETWSAFTDVGTWDAPDTQVSSGDGGSTWSQQGPYAQPSTVANQQNQQQTG